MKYFKIISNKICSINKKHYLYILAIGKDPKPEQQKQQNKMKTAIRFIANTALALVIFGALTLSAMIATGHNGMEIVKYEHTIYVQDYENIYLSIKVK